MDAGGASGSTVPAIALLAALGLFVPAAYADIDPIFGDGFDERACAWSGKPPASGSTCGAGHLVLIGHDFAPMAGARGDTGVAASPKGTGLGQLLVSAVAQTPTEQPPSAIRIAVLDVNTQTGELSEVLGILGGALTVQTTLVDLEGIPSALGASDVLLVPDQNGLFEGSTAPRLAAQLAPLLRAYLEAGGVVVVLDGTHDPGGGARPSANHRILDPALLAIEAAQAFTGCAVVPCNETDPLLAGLAPQVCPSEPVVAFASGEPWVALAHRAADQRDYAFVLHRWFGATTNGPAAIDLDPSVDFGFGLPSRPAFFQRADGQQVAQCQTLSNGTAVHQMAPDGFISVGVGSATFPRLVTFAAAQPLDRLRLALSVNVLVQPPSDSVVVELPGSVLDAASYRVAAGFSTESATVPDPIEVVVGTGLDGIYSIVAEALDADGEILAYTMLNGMTETQGGTVEMPAWKAPNLHPTVTGLAPPGLQSIELSIVQHGNDFDHFEGPDAVERAVDGSALEYSFYADPGPGLPQFTQLTHHAVARFDAGGQPVDVLSERTVRGPLPSSLSVDLVGFLPALTTSTLAFVDDRMRVQWTLQSGTVAGIDGGTVTVAWMGDESHRWDIVVPPGTTLVAPPNPGAAGDAYWPGVLDQPNVRLLELRLDDASFLPSYLHYRQAFDQVTLPRAEAYMLRSTRRITQPE